MLTRCALCLSLVVLPGAFAPCGAQDTRMPVAVPLAEQEWLGPDAYERNGFGFAVGAIRQAEAAPVPGEDTLRDVVGSIPTTTVAPRPTGSYAAGIGDASLARLAVRPADKTTAPSPEAAALSPWTARVTTFRYDLTPGDARPGAPTVWFSLLDQSKLACSGASTDPAISGEC